MTATSDLNDAADAVTTAAMLGSCGNGPHLHTFEEGAAMLRVGVGHLEKRADARQIPFRRVGARRLLSDDDIAQIIADSATGPAQGRSRTPARANARKPAASPRPARRSIV